MTANSGAVLGWDPPDWYWIGTRLVYWIGTSEVFYCSPMSKYDT